MNNLFLTGSGDSGKTTIIKKAVIELDLNPAGFVTEARMEDGWWSSLYIWKSGSYIYGQKDDKDRRLLGSRAGRKSLIRININIFNDYAAGLLEVEEDQELVIMDELGRFEQKAGQFTERVLAVLASPLPVLGVLKKEENPFLNRIRSRDDVDLIIVNRGNREQVYSQLVNKLKSMIIED